MVQPRDMPNHEWSDAPTVPIKSDRYGGEAPTWPGASPPPSAERPERRQAVPAARLTPALAPPSPPPRQPWYIQRAPGIIRLVFTALEIAIAIRIILKLLAANPAAEFTSLIYVLTDLFVAPFQGVFPNPSGNGRVLELSALLAIPIYALLARFCVSVAKIFSDRRPTPTPTR